MYRATFKPEQPEAAAALEAAREDACVALVADIRFACGDNGKRSQPELVEYIRGLARDAARYRWLRDPCSGAERVIFYCRGDYGRGLMSSAMLDAAIDAAMEGKNERERTRLRAWIASSEMLDMRKGRADI